MKSTFEAYRDLVGERAQQSPGLEAACQVLDNLPCSELLTLMTVSSDVRSQDVTTQAVIEGNRFNQPSAVPQRLFHVVEGQILDALPDTEFVELSPLQPFGINTVLAGTNEKNVVATLRRSEANADATTALFRLALLRYLDGDGSSVKLATNTRATRAQVFEGKTKFLPHFKVFGQVSVGQQAGRYGEAELERLIDHMAVEVSILDSVATSDDARFSNTHIAIGNVLLIQDLIDRELVDEGEVRKHTSTPGYDVFSSAGLDIPAEIAFDTPDLDSQLHDLGFSRGVRITKHFQKLLMSKYPELGPRLVLDLSRVAGIRYYKHMAYKIGAQNDEGVSLPLADGGTTSWAQDCTSNKQLYSVTSGIGTELLCSHFLA